MVKQISRSQSPKSISSLSIVSGKVGQRCCPIDIIGIQTSQKVFGIEIVSTSIEIGCKEFDYSFCYNLHLKKKCFDFWFNFANTTFFQTLFRINDTN